MNTHRRNNLRPMILGLAIFLGACTGESCNKQPCEKERTRIASLEALLTERDKQITLLQKQLDQTTKDLDSCMKKLENSKQAAQQDYERHRSQALSKLILKTEQQRQKEAGFFDMINTIVKDQARAARIENNIYAAIQQRRQKYIEMFSYNPIDKQGMLKNPTKAVCLVKRLGSDLLGNGGYKNEQQVLEMLQTNFGVEEGIVIEKMTLEQLCTLAKD